MARKPREKSPDTIFHVFSRGNYRKDIFDDDGAVQSFMDSVREVTTRAGWHIYTFTIMPNHYHLMVRTPRANLPRGMHLLLSAFAKRFNALRGEIGHVFQGRYNAKRMPAGLSAGRLFDYINLNLVRKDLATVDGLALEVKSGIRGLCQPELRGEFRMGEALERFIGLPDNPQGWASYLAHLKVVSKEDPDAKAFELDWDHATFVESVQLPRNPKGPVGPLGLSDAEIAALDDRHTEETFRALIKHHGKSPEVIEKERGIAPWKMEVAKEMFRITTVSERWLVKHLNAGSPDYFMKLYREQF